MADPVVAITSISLATRFTTRSQVLLRRCRSYSLQELDVSHLVSDGKFDCSGEASWVDLLDPMVIRGSNCRSSFIPVAKQMTRWVELNPPIIIGEA